MGLRRRPRSGAAESVASTAVARRWQVGLHRRHVERVGRDQGDPRHPDDGHGAERGGAAGAAAQARRCRRSTPLLDPSVRERWNDYGIGLLLQGDIKNAEATFLKVTEMEPGYADGWVNVGARAHPGRQHGGAETMLRKALTIDPEPGQDAFLPRHGAEERSAATTRRSTHLRTRRGAVSARPRRAESARARAVPEAQFNDGDRRRSRRAGDRSRGSAGPLQPDALLSGPRRCRPRRRASGRSTSGSRPTSRRRRSPDRIGSCIPRTTTSGSRSTSTTAPAPEVAIDGSDAGI